MNTYGYNDILYVNILYERIVYDILYEPQKSQMVEIVFPSIPIDFILNHCITLKMITYCFPPNGSLNDYRNYKLLEKQF